MVLLNLKTYLESTNDNCTKLLEVIEDYISDEVNAAQYIFAAPSMMDLGRAKQNFPELNIVAQHVDAANAGSTTGWTPAEIVKNLGIEYAIYNHSEHRVMPDAKVQEIQDKGIKLVCCCENIEEAKYFLQFNPFAIAYEPKDLIGSGVSVTTRPEAVKEFIEATKGKTKVMIGAGVSTGEDVAKGLELGAEGFLLASAFVKASDPKAKLVELVKPFLKS